MIINDEEFGYMHLNTSKAEKDITKEDIEQLKEIARKVKEQRKIDEYVNNK
ncbi:MULTISPECIES: hypothetical protein [Staphylococcus]|mgnify:CR=1 FL=1|uniref:hypothetical protein n=1 Tax=Staphylococcus TaxID=1279 RepID=UPI001304845E|nr:MULTISPECIES: hypothetical protein [Staphylococcus]MCA2501740.1 hypothetical protein [Staphylococcus xylosus]MCE7780637.1 hypothetical protein [Staphylococcus xylosus]MEB5782996.1 hypothetical protein [Staphylococcus pseudoxylosus]UBV34105.1 hypothetical protein JGY90_10355 [Staphylococcus xylosus]